MYSNRKEIYYAIKLIWLFRYLDAGRKQESKIGDLYYDAGVLNEYKTILEGLGIDSKEWLLFLYFENKTWFQCRKYTNEDIMTSTEEVISFLSEFIEFIVKQGYGMGKTAAFYFK